jgi:hypothetical protein
MNLERLLDNLEKIYGKKPIGRDYLNRREALPTEIQEVIEKSKLNGNGHKKDINGSSS